MRDLTSAKNYLKDQFSNSGDSPWLEGWICGYTDPDNAGENNHTERDELFEYLICLRENAISKQDVQ